MHTDFTCKNKFSMPKFWAPKVCPYDHDRFKPDETRYDSGLSPAMRIVSHQNFFFDESVKIYGKSIKHIKRKWSYQQNESAKNYENTKKPVFLIDAS